MTLAVAASPTAAKIQLKFFSLNNAFRRWHATVQKQSTEDSSDTSRQLHYVFCGSFQHITYEPCLPQSAPESLSGKLMLNSGMNNLLKAEVQNTQFAFATVCREINASGKKTRMFAAVMLSKLSR
ncbi:hypothetical protein M513_09886 [Trichuris suis]|uniref:Uncharacterized protein n=1 Tax=Trichuris suis TaxID=68888 RepID=A0A085LW89_9BILA|nr:hypothetical protein M513_09886 [Trichuris suis]